MKSITSPTAALALRHFCNGVKQKKKTGSCPISCQCGNEPAAPLQRRQLFAMGQQVHSLLRLGNAIITLRGNIVYLNENQPPLALLARFQYLVNEQRD